MRSGWWPIRLTRYRPTGLQNVLSAAFVPFGAVVTLAALAQEQSGMPDAPSAAVVCAFAVVALGWSVHFAVLAWRVG